LVTWPAPLPWDGKGLRAAGRLLVPVSQRAVSAAQRFGQLIPRSQYLIPADVRPIGLTLRVPGLLELPDHAGVVELQIGEERVRAMVAPHHLGGLSFANSLVDALHELEASAAWYARAWARIGAESGERAPTDATRAATLRSLADDLAGALIAISASPRTALTRRRVAVDLVAATVVDDDAIAIAASNPLLWGTGTPIPMGFSGPAQMPERVAEPRSELTLDHPANRRLAWLLRDLRVHLSAVRRLIGKVDELDRLSDAIELLMWVLRDVAPDAGRGPVHAIAADPRYRTVLEAWLALQEDLVSRPLDTARMLSGTQSLDKLYEDWVTLSFVDFWCEVLSVNSAARTQALADVWVRLSGLERDSPVVLSNSDHTAAIWVQHEIRTPWESALSPTGLSATPRRAKPDILLALSSGGHPAGWFAYDAKLRLEEDDYPPSDALDDLAFYREAIRDGSGHVRTLKRAHALFPGVQRNNRHAFDKARNFGVGAIPLAPRACEELRRELAGLIAPEPYLEP
jgi:hypothetical protein